MPDIKLIALDHEDLAVLSAHTQDAVLRIADMTFQPQQKRFAAVINRFDWSDLIAAGSTRGAKTPRRRRRAGLRFERVKSAKVQGINLDDKRATLSLLAITFAPGADEGDGSSSGPEGHVTLTFSGGGAIRLTVECIEAELKDLGAVWATQNVPAHPDETD